MPEWVTFPTTPLQINSITQIADDVASLNTPIRAAAQAASATLSAASAQLQDTTSAVRGVVDAAVATVESTLADVFQNNVSVAVHTNLEWDPDWQFRRRPGQADTIRDYVNDHELPWIGRGMSGWLLDLRRSARDPANPFRPYSDADTSVGGFIVLKGVQVGQDLNILSHLYKAFSAQSDFATLFSMLDFEYADPRKEALMRMGPGAKSSFIQAVSTPLSEPPGLPQLITNYEPLRGNYPKWVSVPMANAVPPLTEFFEAMRGMTAAVEQGVERTEHLNRLVDLMQLRADLLVAAADRVAGVNASLSSLDAFFAGAYALYLPPEPGGFDGFIGRAASAASVPDFGERGIVGGVALVASHDSVLNHLEAFFGLLGLQLSTLADTATTRTQNLDAVYGDLF